MCGVQRGETEISGNKKEIIMGGFFIVVMVGRFAAFLSKWLVESTSNY